MKKSHFFILGIMLFSNGLTQPIFAGEIYRFVDAEGTIHFTDQPPVTKKTKVDRLSDVAVGSVKIYKFVDNSGVIHLSDTASDPRYKLIYQGSGTLQSFSGQSYSIAAALHKKYVDYADIIQDAATRTHLEAALIHAVIQAESAYNENAVSPKGAVGLMQLMPGTAARYGVIDSKDATENIDGGTRYLKDLLEMFSDNKELAVAAYNAGENAVIRYGYQIPPYKETKNYVKTVMSLYQAYQDEFGSY